MKRAIISIITVIVFSCIWNVNSTPTSLAQMRGQGGSPLMREAQRAWKGEYSPEDLRKWEKRAKKLRSDEKWPGVALCYNVIGVIHNQEGNLKEALSYFNQSLEITRKHGIEKLTARNLLCIGGIQWFQGRGDEGLKSLRECVEIAQRTGMTGVAGRGLHLLSSIARSKGRHREAMGYVEQALQMAKDSGSDQLMMLCLYDMGQIHRLQGNFEKARDHFTRSLDLAKQLNNRTWMAFNFAELGDVCQGQGDFRGALENYRQSLEHFESLNNKKGLAVTYNKMGKAHLRMKDLKSALPYFEKSHDLARDMGMKPLVAFTSLNMGKAYSRMGRPEDALAKTDEAMAIYKEVDIPDALRECYFMKGALLERKGDIPGAEKHYAQSVKILETLREDVAGGEEEMVAFVEIRGHSYQRLIALLLKQGKIAEALDYLERSRLRNLRDQFDQLAPRLSSEEEEEAKAREKVLREEIEAARTQLVEEKSKPKEAQDVAKIAQLETQLNDKRQQYIEYITT